MKLNKDYVAVLIFGILLCLAIGLFLGVDFGPDLQNYHLYSGYLATNSYRLTSDIIPTNIQGYFNPYFYIIIYFLYENLQAKYVLAIVSIIHGVNLLAAYVLIRKATQFSEKFNSKILAFSCAIFGVSSPFFISMIGASWTDNITPIFILFGISIIISELILKKSRSNYYYLIIGGALVGMSMGVKLTNIAFIIGLVPALIYLILNSKNESLNILLSSVTVLIGAMIGFVLFNGYWMYVLYINFNNPFFPFFNSIFLSTDLISAYTTTIKPWAAAQNIFDFIKYPFQWAIGVPPPSEWKFRDIRYALILIMIVFAVILYLKDKNKNKNKNNHINDDNTLKSNYVIIRGFIVIWCIFSYIFWQNEFGALRYLVPFSLLTGLIILYLIDIIFKNTKLRITYIILLFVGISCFNQNPPFGRLMMGNNWNLPKIPSQLLNNSYLYLNSGVSIGIPFLNKNSIFIGYPYFTPDDGLNRKALDILDNNQLQVRSLIDRRSESFDKVRLKSLGFEKNPFNCLYFNVGPVQYESCELNKVQESRDLGVVPYFSKVNFSNKFLNLIESSNGFYTEEAAGTWTSDLHSEIVFGANLPRQFTLKIQAFSFNRIAKDGVNLSVGNEMKHIKFRESSEFKFLDFNFPIDIPLNNKISLDVKNIFSPSEVSKSTDTRKLGIHLQSIEILPYKYREYDFSSKSDINENFSSAVGFSIQEPKGIWTSSNQAIIRLNEFSAENSILEITASSLPQFENKLISIDFGGVKYPLILSADKNIYKFNVNKSGNELLFQIPFAESPKNLNISADTRKLGIFIERIRFIPH